jgi:hypothetical protein
MQFDFEVYLADNILTIHKHDETFFDITIHTFWDWIVANKLNVEYDNGEEVESISKIEYFDLPYEDIKKNISQYLLTPKFKKYF